MEGDPGAAWGSGLLARARSAPVAPRKVPQFCIAQMMGHGDTRMLERVHGPSDA